MSAALLPVRHRYVDISTNSLGNSAQDQAQLPQFIASFGL